MSSTKYKCKLFRDKIAVEVLDYPSHVQIVAAILKQLMPTHQWEIEIEEIVEEIATSTFPPLYWPESIVRCDLRDGELVLTVPNLKEFREIRESIRDLGFKWRRNRMWSATYTIERSTDAYRDRLMETLQALIDQKLPPPKATEEEKSEYEKKRERDHKLFMGGEEL